MFRRRATAVWKGSGPEGSGTLTAPVSGIFKDTPYSANARFKDEPGTNPEELIAAAHAGCFAMALSFSLTKSGFTADTITTKAVLTLDQVDGNWTVTGIVLDLSAKIPGIDEAKFMEIANGAKANCPISRLLNTEITLKATLE